MGGHVAVPDCRSSRDRPVKARGEREMLGKCEHDAAEHYADQHPGEQHGDVAPVADPYHPGEYEIHGLSLTRGRCPRVECPRRRHTGAVPPHRLRGLLLTPGASAGRDNPSLVAIDAAVSALGITVERIDFPYFLAGRRRPDSPDVLTRTIIDAASELATRSGGKQAAVIVGGRSMGGRMCSMAVADGLPAAGLVLVSYPLHPPGRPERLRTAHFPDIDVPCLFVSGTKDAFGSPEELEEACSAIKGSVTHVWIERGDHGLRRSDEVVAAAVVAWLKERWPSSARSQLSRPVRRETRATVENEQ